MNLAGKTAIVTGGGSGIGEAIVRLFAAQGAAVIIADWNEKDSSRLAVELTSSGHQAHSGKSRCFKRFRCQGAYPRDPT